MVTFTIERLVGNIPALQRLTELHYKEVAPYDDIPLNIDWNKFIRLEEAGILKFYTMRKNGFLIGYASFLVSASIEYSTSLQASMNNIFIHPDNRGRGSRFITWCDEQLKNLGVQVVYHHVKSKNDYGLLLKRLGYVTMNIEYSKRLDK